MAITATQKTTGLSDVGATSYVVPVSITPTANKLQIAAVYARIVAGTANFPTITGNSLTWVSIGNSVATTGEQEITFLRALGSSPTAGSPTIDFAGQSQQRCYWSFTEFDGIDTSGANGSGAIVQFVPAKDEGATNTGLLVTLASFGSANNASFGYVRGSDAGITAGSGFTELGQNSGATFTEAEWKLNDNTVDWSWALSTAFAYGAGIEIKAATALTNNSQLTTLNAG